MKNILTNYLADDGLLRLDLDDRRDPFPGEFKKTVKNENGILFLAELCLEHVYKGYELPAELRAAATCALTMTRVGRTGTFDRRPGDKNLVNSHDNMLGTIILAYLVDFKTMLDVIYDWGLKNKWCYNNINPGKYDIRAVMLPRERAVLKTALGLPMDELDFAWLVASVFTRSRPPRNMRTRTLFFKLTAPGTLTERILSGWYDWWGGDKRFAKEVGSYYLDIGHPFRVMVEDGV